MNRNRLKQNLKNIVAEERHLRFVQDQETGLYVPYENEDEMRILVENGEMYKIAFGYFDPSTGEYVEFGVTDSYYMADCLMFNDEDYFAGVGCFVTYPMYSDDAYSIENNPATGEKQLFRSFTAFELVHDGPTPLGYKSYDLGMKMVEFED